MTPREQALSIKSRGFPDDEMEQVLREGSFELLDEVCLLVGYTIPAMRRRRTKEWRARQLEAERARS